MLSAKENVFILMPYGCCVKIKILKIGKIAYFMACFAFVNRKIYLTLCYVTLERFFQLKYVNAYVFIYNKGRSF